MSAMKLDENGHDRRATSPVAEAVAAEPVAWTDEQIIELAVAHSNYRETGANGTEFEVISHARLIAFSRALVARLQQEIQRLTEELAEAQQRYVDANEARIDAEAAASRIAALEAQLAERVYDPLDQLRKLIERKEKQRDTVETILATILVNLKHGAPADKLLEWYDNEGKAALAALEPAAPEGRQPVAYGESIDGKIVSVRFDKSRHCTVPLYTRPSEQAVTDAMERFEKIAEIIRRNLFHQQEKISDARQIAIEGAEALKAAMEAGG